MARHGTVWYGMAWYGGAGVPQANWYDAHGSWDGSLAIPNAWNGIREPTVVMTTVMGTKPGLLGGGIGMASDASWGVIDLLVPDGSFYRTKLPFCHAPAGRLRLFVTHHHAGLWQHHCNVASQCVAFGIAPSRAPR